MSNIDANGFYVSGRFAGKHVDVVAQYAANLEDAMPKESPGDKPPEETPPQPKSPEELLADHAKGRAGAAELLTAERFRSDDEAAFRLKIGAEEFAKHGKTVTDVVSKMPLPQQMVKDVHWMVFVQLRSSDPEFQKRFLGAAEPAPAPPPPEEAPEGETEEERAAQPATEAVVEPPAAPPPPFPTPKATPPTAAPTPANRSSKPISPRPKLVANDKIKRAAREWGIPVEEYLLRLEKGGVTQDSLENMSKPKEESRHRSVFDRTTATQ